jgi:hypothetical protein
VIPHHPTPRQIHRYPSRPLLGRSEEEVVSVETVDKKHKFVDEAVFLDCSPSSHHSLSERFAHKLQQTP